MGGVVRGQVAVVSAPLEALETLARRLALAFEADPVYRWLFPDAGRRLKKLEALFAVFLRPLMAAGTVFTTPQREGVSVWVPPKGKVAPGWRGQIRQPFEIVRLLGKRIWRGLLWWRLVETRQPRYPHWKLFLIGVLPEHQGRGIGSALLRPILARCDEEGWPIYLDTGHPGNLPFYHRVGFEVVRKVELPQGPTVFQMIRPPR